MAHVRRLASTAFLAGLLIGVGVALPGCAPSEGIGSGTGGSGEAGSGGAGTAGAAGSAGTTGTAGTTGAAGTTATAGTTGTGGTTGTAGASGMAGRGGTTGSGGTTGTAGSGGTTGSGGSSATGGATGSGGVGGRAGNGGAVGSGGTGGGVGGSGGGTATAPSCAPGGPGMTDCGSGRESCCISLAITGGTYNRTYRNSGSGPTGQADPATVSNFRLDKYLVTVGRYRQFVAAFNGGWMPPAGSGKHAYLTGGGLAATAGGTETGWDASWSSTTYLHPTNSTLTGGSRGARPLRER
jgi:hypothetical protein